MKYLITVSLFIFISIGLGYAQKEDYIWGFGYNYEHDTFVYGLQGGIELNFNISPPDTDFVRRANDFSSTNASICDENGNLLFYTNGIYIGDRRYKIMPNGKGLNKWSTLGQNADQGAMIIRIPNSQNKYMVFYGKIDVFNTRNGKLSGGNIITYYSVVDMTQNNGYGDIVKKNVVLSLDTLKTGTFTACRHANGRDWWIPLIRLEDSWIDVFLLTPNGISFDHRDSVLLPLKLVGSGVACFSPDGSKYIHGEVRDIYEGFHIDLFDFDRCSGSFTNQIQFFSKDTMGDLGVAISPNSRFAYVMVDENVFQYDLWSSDIPNSKDTVASYDGHVDITISNFGVSSLGPDNKIYITPKSTNRYLHVIHAPDSAGIDCRVEQRAIMLPARNHGTMPNFPHFRLGALEGSECDTILSVSANENHKLDVKIFPNPTSNYLSIRINNGLVNNIDYVIYDMNGQAVASGKTSSDININQLDSGVYFIELIESEKTLMMQKFCKL